MTLDWLHIAVLLGALQGFFLAAVLATQRRNPTANRLLAAAMLAFSIHLTSAVYHAAGLEQRFPHFFGAAYPMPLLYGPLIYLYAVTASDRTRRLRWMDGLHFVPFVAVVLAALPIYLMSGAEKLAFHQALLRGVQPQLITVVDPLKFVSGVSYATATILFLRRHRARVKDSYSTVERVSLQWLLQLAAAGAGIWAIATTFAVLAPLEHPLLARADDAVALAIAILVYWIGYMALRQPEIFNFAKLDQQPQPSSPAIGSSGSSGSSGVFGSSGSAFMPPPAPASPEPPAAAATARYERSGLGDREAVALKNALLALMDAERPYQDSDLTLADLAERLETTPHKLSEVLNSQIGQTFYDFVNDYRVRDVQRRIADERTRHLKILSLAMDAGFASKSTFNHVFRKHTGRTPSAYRRSVAG